MSNFEIGSMVRIKNACQGDLEEGIRDGMIGRVVGRHQTSTGKRGWFVRLPGITVKGRLTKDANGNLVFWEDQLLPESVSGAVESATASFEVGDRVVISAEWACASEDVTGVIIYVEGGDGVFAYSVLRDDNEVGAGVEYSWACDSRHLKHAPKASISSRVEAHYATLGDLRRASKQANEHLAATRQALRDAEKKSEESFKAQADAENVMRELLDEAVGIEWQARVF